MELFGFLNCHKPVGMTSRDLVNLATGAIRRTFRESQSPLSGEKFDNGPSRRKPPKVGHAGTLDPLAEGVLVIAVGPASRLIEYVQQTPKQYRAKFRLGCHSESGDLETELDQQKTPRVPERIEIERAAESMIGTIRQTPPRYSAIKIAGRRAYKMARTGESFDMPSRDVRIDELQVLEYRFPELTIDIRCGSGTYIRSLGIDLANRCGTQAVMTELVRTQVGPFHLDDSIDHQVLRAGDAANHLLPASLGVCHLPSACVTDDLARRLGNGLSVSVDAVSTSQPASADQSVAAVDDTGRLLAIVRRCGDEYRPHRVFHR